MSVRKRFNIVDSLLRDIMKTNPKTRNSDWELMFAVWEKQGIYLSTETKASLKLAHSPETIRRTRQKIQEKGDFLPTENVARERRNLQAEHRAAHKNGLTDSSSVSELPKEPIGYKTVVVGGIERTFAVYS